MSNEKAIEMINAYLHEDCNNAEWVDCLVECRIALDRLIPKKIMLNKKIQNVGYCRRCGRELYTADDNLRFCPVCGQALDLGGT